MCEVFSGQHLWDGHLLRLKKLMALISVHRGTSMAHPLRVGYSDLKHRAVHLQVSHFQHIQVAFSSPRGLQQGQERVHLTLHSTEATTVTSTSRPIATVRTPTALTLVPSDPLGTLREPP